MKTLAVLLLSLSLSNSSNVYEKLIMQSVKDRIITDRLLQDRRDVLLQRIQEMKPFMDYSNTPIDFKLEYRKVYSEYEFLSDFIYMRSSNHSQN